MGMQSYPVFDTGLVITDEMLPYMIRAAIVKFNDIALTERDAAIMKMFSTGLRRSQSKKSHLLKHFSTIIFCVCL